MTRLPFVALLPFLVFGCDKRPNVVEKTQVKGQSFLLSAKDFDLQTVVSTLKADKVKSAEDLQKFVNDPTTGINNVDVDKDKKIDFIQVTEERQPKGAIALDFKAIPSTTKNPKEAVTVASVAFSKTAEAVEVSGGYPNYVNGHQNHYYQYRQPGLSFGEAMFLMWMFQPRPVYQPAFSPATYSPRPLMDTGALETRRTTYHKKVTVSPVAVKKAPASFSVPSAQRVPSRFKKATAGTTFKSRSGLTNKFQNRQGATNRKASGWGWGSGKSTTKPKKSSGWGFGSSRKKSSGWGSSSSSRRRSTSFSTRRRR